MNGQHQPSWWARLRSILQVFNTTQRVVFVLLLVVAVVSGSLLLWRLYLRGTTPVPAHGGSYAEGVIGEPRAINPILAPINDADRDLATLVFDGLMRVNGAGDIVPALAEDYAVGDFGKVYEFTLRRDAVWHDGTPITAEDVVFTINRIQDPDFRSPLRQNWAGVTVEAVDNHTVRFNLNTPYAPFLANTTVGILPRHIWSSIPAANFSLAEENLRAVGSGPYHVVRFERDRHGSIRSVQLKAFDQYYEGRPYINTITLHFYPNEEAMIAGYNRGEIDGLSFLSPQNDALVRGADDLQSINLRLPRYFAVFFNQSRSRALSDRAVRQALAHATNKQQIVSQVLGNNGAVLETAIPPGVLGHTDDATTYSHDPDKARTLLNNAGWVLGSNLQEEQTDAPPEEPTEESVSSLDPTLRYASNEDGDEEGPTPLIVELVTTDWPELVTVAQVIANQWEQVGVRTTVRITNVAEVQEEIIRPRNYQALLFGQILGAEPDPFSFWHSSQKKDPGLNLALYDNDDVDKLLEEARQTLDPKERREKYKLFQQQLADDIPAIFLYVPQFRYTPDNAINGIDISFLPLPSDRFAEVHTWFIATDRERQ